MTRVAVAHDSLATTGGAERVVVALASAFPDAPIHTLVHDRDATFEALRDARVETSWLDRLGPVRRNYRMLAPIGAIAFAARRIDADIVICSTSGLAHHVRTSGKKIVYCHTPARWIHDSATYLDGFGRLVRIAAATARRPLAALDRRAMRGVDRVVVNSAQIAAEVAEVYDIDATVVRPCSALDLDGRVQPLPDVAPGFVFAPVRAVAYKRLDLLVDAARALPDRTFLHIGDGPHRGDLVRDAPANFVSVGRVSDAVVRWAYRSASLVALTSADDYGLVPLEAAAHGVTTVAPDARGLLDHDPAHLSTYEYGSATALCETIRAAPAATRGLWPDRLGRERFTAEINAIVAEVAGR